MTQSLVKNLIHIIFSTKERRDLLFDTQVRSEMHAYINSICNQLGCPAIESGGTGNHIHLLCSLSKNTAGAALVKELKRVSSVWIKTKGLDYQNFYWQGDYGYFSVSPKDVSAVIRYVEHQEEHHKSVDFKDELRGFFRKYDVAFDENYLWD